MMGAVKPRASVHRVIYAVIAGIVALCCVANADARTLRGTPKNDRLLGTTAADVLRGLSGNDRIDGRGGADRIYGDAGDDIILADARSRISGGAGRDQVTVTHASV